MKFVGLFPKKIVSPGKGKREIKRGDVCFEFIFVHKYNHQNLSFYFSNSQTNSPFTFQKKIWKIKEERIFEFKKMEKKIGKKWGIDKKKKKLIPDRKLLLGTFEMKTKWK